MENETEEVVEVELYDKDGNPLEEERVVEAPQQETVDVEDEYKVPEKFQGKSLEDVIKAYENAEKELGRKNNEVGELRKLTDQILQNNLAPAQQQENNKDDTSVGFDDFVDNPDAAIEKALSRNPTLRKMEESIAMSTQQKAREALLSAHPDADEVVGDAAFQSWLQAKPSRVEMLATAHKTNNADMASDVLDLYKQTRRVTNEEAVTERDAKAKASARKASVETGSTPASTKKRYRRADLIHMKIHQPERYRAQEAEIMKAYAEGRVK